MTDVIIAGVGQTPVGEHWEIALRELALMAIREALADAGHLRPQALYVGNMLATNLSNQAHLGALLADEAFLRGIEAASLEAGGASGGAALRQGYLAVASGLVDVALVVGAEKFTDRVGASIEAAVSTTSDSDFEAVQGVTADAQAAMVMQRYIHEYGVPPDGLAGFPLIAHKNAEGNPNAMFRKAIRPETYAAAPSVNEPLRQYDIAPNADGAAALVLVRSTAGDAPAGRRRVAIAGSASVVDTLALHDRADLLEFGACGTSARSALRQAAIPLDEVDLFEYHDSYSIYAALALEAVGFAERGKGWKLASEGKLERTGTIPCATMGGLKARGFPGGATGVYQAVEATLQLQERAGANQLAATEWGLIQSVGGPGSTAIAHVLHGLS